VKVLLCLVLLVGVTPAFAGLVTNGTFDNNCAGWALAQTDGFTCSATEGNPGSALVLNNGPGPVPQASQSISGLLVGGLYEITIDGKTHYNCCNSAVTPGAGVGIDGRQFDFLIVNNQPWTTYTFDFTYSGASNVLVISAQRNGTDSDGEFDNVDINLLKAPSGTPEPGSFLLIGAGLIALGGRKLRRTSGRVAV
jgi:PEP-CTERM motif-containing protein